MDRDRSVRQFAVQSWATALVRTSWAAALLCTILFMAVHLGIFRPGYAINDDLQIISIAAGYPGGTPVPFLVFSNILLGFLLVPLYSLRTTINWEMLLLSGVNFVSLCVLLYVLFSGPISRRNKILGAALILSCVAYFALNLTFTSAASLSCFAGLCLLLATTSLSSAAGKMRLLMGLALLLAGSLIRLQMLALVLPVFVPAVLFAFRPIQIRILVLASILGGLLIAGAYAIDRLYVRANPSWNVYYFYNKTAQMLQDAHRLDNVGTQIRRIGWTGNDQELFARSFFPDAGIYSVERIKYLVEHVPGTSQNPAYTLETFSARLARPTSILFFMAIAATWLWCLARGPSRCEVMALVSILAISLAENVGLVWYYKNPDYVLWALLAQTAILEVLILNWPGSQHTRRPSPVLVSGIGRVLDAGVLLLVVATAAISLYQSFGTSSDNLHKRQAYMRILGDLENLQADGKIARNALIVSPAHGLPMEWSNPFVLEWPPIPYLDMGWMTFSPHYQAVLDAYGIQSLASALYGKENIYLICKANLTEYLGRYYNEHGNIAVQFEPIYAMPNTFHFAGYDGVYLYKVTRPE